jgi:uncharacterized phage-associated protein
MVKIKYIIRYFVEHYPHKTELSKTRLTKMVYLADWYSAIKNGKQLTEIVWYFDHFGPYVVDVFNTVKEDHRIEIKTEFNQYGRPKQVIGLKERQFDFLFKNRLDESTISILNEVIEDTKILYWSDFIAYVYSTYPIKHSPKYSTLDLHTLAKKCKLTGFRI